VGTFVLIFGAIALGSNGAAIASRGPQMWAMLGQLVAILLAAFLSLWGSLALFACWKAVVAVDEAGIEVYGRFIPWRAITTVVIEIRGGHEYFRVRTSRPTLKVTIPPLADMGRFQDAVAQYAGKDSPLATALESAGA